MHYAERAAPFEYELGGSQSRSGKVSCLCWQSNPPSCSVEFVITSRRISVATLVFFIIVFIAYRALTLL